MPSGGCPEATAGAASPSARLVPAGLDAVEPPLVPPWLQARPAGRWQGRPPLQIACTFRFHTPQAALHPDVTGLFSPCFLSLQQPKAGGLPAAAPAAPAPHPTLPTYNTTSAQNLLLSLFFGRLLLILTLNLNSNPGLCTPLSGRACAAPFPAGMRASRCPHPTSSQPATHAHLPSRLAVSLPDCRFSHAPPAKSLLLSAASKLQTAHNSSPTVLARISSYLHAPSCFHTHVPPPHPLACSTACCSVLWCLLVCLAL